MPKFVDPITKLFDYDSLHSVTKQVAVSLNKLIDVNYYPNEKTKRSNFLHRPIGIGIQGLADVFMLMDLPFTSDKAKETNKLIFETIYHASLESSNETAIQRKPYMQRVIDEYKDTVGMHSIQNSHNTVDTTRFKDTNIDKCKPIINEIQNLPQEYAGSYSTFVGSPHMKVFFNLICGASHHQANMTGIN